MSRRRWLGLAVLLIVLLCVPLVVHSDYLLNVADIAGIYAIAVLGLGILLGFAGQLSLAQAAFFGIGAYASGYMTVHWGWPVLPSMAVARWT